MDIGEIENLLKNFRWETLSKMYGCAHSSIIGFISTEWIRFSPENSILDGAPSPKIGGSRKGQTNADILLCKGDRPYIAVEVETNISKYDKKLDSLFTYLNNKNDFDGIEFGLLFMTNLCAGNTKYKQNWEKIKQRVTKNGENDIALISIIKERAQLKEEDTSLNALRRRNDYFPWNIITVAYWIYSANRITEGILWKK